MKKVKLMLLVGVMAILVGNLVGCSTPSSADIDELNARIAQLESEKEALEKHYTESYELRNTLDIKSRKIYKALGNKDIDYLKEVTSDTTEFHPDKISFNNQSDIHFVSFNESESPVLRQRFYILSPDSTTFTTGYELLSEGAEMIPVIHFTYQKENGEWKLFMITTE